MKKLKFVIIGETQVGKTSLINQYVNNQFEGDYLMTIGNDKTTKEITIDEKKVTLEIWDTIGHETLRAANKIFMKNTNIALMVYDITHRDSFDNLNQFYKEFISNNTENKMIIGVTANKSDLYENAEVTKEEGEDYANKIKASFFESTATDHENVENIFNELTKAYINKFEPGEEKISTKTITQINSTNQNNEIGKTTEMTENNNDSSSQVKNEEFKEEFNSDEINDIKIEKDDKSSSSKCIII